MFAISETPVALQYTWCGARRRVTGRVRTGEGKWVVLIFHAAGPGKSRRKQQGRRCRLGGRTQHAAQKGRAHHAGAREAVLKRDDRRRHLRRAEGIEGTSQRRSAIRSASCSGAVPVLPPRSQRAGALLPRLSAAQAGPHMPPLFPRSSLSPVAVPSLPLRRTRSTRLGAAPFLPVARVLRLVRLVEDEAPLEPLPAAPLDDLVHARGLALRVEVVRFQTVVKGAVETAQKKEQTRGAKQSQLSDAGRGSSAGARRQGGVGSGVVPLCW